MPLAPLQDRRFGSAAGRGENRRKTVPSGPVRSTETSPWCCCMMLWTTVNPRPMPFSLPWLTKG